MGEDAVQAGHSAVVEAGGGDGGEGEGECRFFGYREVGGAGAGDYDGLFGGGGGGFVFLFLEDDGIGANGNESGGFVVFHLAVLEGSEAEDFFVDGFVHPRGQDGLGGVR